MIKKSDTLPSGKYLILIQQIECCSNFVKYRYEICVGPYAGYGATCLKERGSYPLFNQFILPKGFFALVAFLKAAGISIPQAGISPDDLQGSNDLIQKAVGKRLWVYLESHGQYISIKRHDLFCSAPILPDDISIGDGPWNNGSEVLSHATALSCYSGLPRIFVDVRERYSPMISWCQEHQIIPVPQFFSAGDYTTPESINIVDRKSGIFELYSDFSNPKRYSSYFTAAQMAASMGKNLIYVISTQPGDHISCVGDLKNWEAKIPSKNIIVNGKSTCRNISLYHNHFQNTEFVFIPENQQCQTIFDLIRAA